MKDQISIEYAFTIYSIKYTVNNHASSLSFLPFPPFLFSPPPQWASVLSRVAIEQERMLPVVLDLLRTNNDQELRSLTGFLRNLSRHAKDKNDVGQCPRSFSLSSASVVK